MVSSNTFLSDRIKRILFVVFAFFLFYFISFIIDPFDAYWQGYFQRNIWSLLVDWTVSFIFCLLISEFSIFIHTRLNRRLPWTQNPTKRFLTETVCNLLVIFIILLINVLSLEFLYEEEGYYNKANSIEELRGFIQWMTASVIISFVIIAINTGSLLISKWKNTEMEMAKHKLKAAELRQVSIEAELSSLKMQLDPHFIFNNLSVLSELILEDQQLGYAYSENFAKVYRFLLLNARKNVITLAEELAFLEAYIFLMKHRIGEGVQFEINVDQNSNQLFLPPLTLQLLIENALKHNKTTKIEPLIIRIYSQGPTLLIVDNTRNPMEVNSVYSFGIGIQNIQRRFHLLSHRQPEIRKDENLFKVMIYLMDYDQ